MPKDSSWFVYLLRCADGSLYTGITNDLARRCRQHNAGTASRYTRSRLAGGDWFITSRKRAAVWPCGGEVAIKRLTRCEKESLVRKAG